MLGRRGSWKIFGAGQWVVPHPVVIDAYCQNIGSYFFYHPKVTRYGTFLLYIAITIIMIGMRWSNKIGDLLLTESQLQCQLSRIFQFFIIIIMITMIVMMRRSKISDPLSTHSADSRGCRRLPPRESPIKRIRRTTPTQPSSSSLSSSSSTQRHTSNTTQNWENTEIFISIPISASSPDDCMIGERGGHTFEKCEKVCGFYFSVSKNLREKCVNRDDKISRQMCVNQWKV